MEEPPTFQAAAMCTECLAPFTTFKRRHHCRACGRSFCNEHSSNQKKVCLTSLHPVRVLQKIEGKRDVCFVCSVKVSPSARGCITPYLCQLIPRECFLFRSPCTPILKALAQHGLYNLVRVCNECFNPPTIPGSNLPTSRPVAVHTATQFSNLNLGTENCLLSKEENVPEVSHKTSFTCTCGMPLCICEAPSIPEVASFRVHTYAPQKSREVRKFSSSNPSLFQTPTSTLSDNSSPFSGRTTNLGSSLPPSNSYDLSGEGIREAVRNGDVCAVKELLAQGVSVNYVDKQGMSLLHLAAMFNFTEMAFVLIDSGADVHAKNGQGETPLDCAQATLEHKMRQRRQSIVPR